MFSNTMQVLRKFTDDNLFNGVVLKITKDNQEIFFEKLGYNNKELKTRIQRDNIFSIYSMTKPIVVFAFMTLVEKKLVNVNQKVNEFYPSFDARITIKSLLTMTSGITYFWSQNESAKQAKQLVEKMENENISLQEFCELLSQIEWDYQPNSFWHYGLNIDVIGGIIEKITKKDLQVFLQETIFDPLEMKDTAFYTKDMNRHTTVYDFYANPEKNILKEHNDWHWLMPFVDKQPNASMGGSGLFSTADDYSKFLNVLLTGQYNNKHLLNKDLIDEMSSNQLGELTHTFKWTLNGDYAYGYGVRVRLKNEQFPLTEVGEFGWDGALGSAGLVDPKNNITLTFMGSSFPGNNRIVASELFGAVYKDLREQKIIK